MRAYSTLMYLGSSLGLHFLSGLDAAMFQKVKSSLTSAHCEEWDNEMQNQGRAQALFACLSQALSEEEMPSGENGSAPSVPGADPGLVQKLLPWSMVGAGPNLGHFCLTHRAFLGCFMFFTAEYLCRIQNLCDSAENQREGRDL